MTLTKVCHGRIKELISPEIHYGGTRMAVSPPEIDTRILLLGYIGTIKFFGSVHGTSGTWLGVEWDDPQRGKHDGAKDGIQYFTCAWVPH